MTKIVNNPRETWNAKNNTNNKIVIGDLPQLPSFLPGDVHNLLRYATKEEIQLSQNFVNLVKNGIITLTKTTESSSDRILPEKIEIAVNSVEENEILKESETNDIYLKLDGSNTNQNIRINNFGLQEVGFIDLNSNSAKLFFGTNQNSSIYFDGTDLNIESANPSLPGVVKINDDVEIDGSLTMNSQNITDVGGLHFNRATELTISAGAVTVTQGHHSIDTEADAANDDLDTINGGNAGEILLILPKDSSRTVRIRNGVGNIYLKHQVDSHSLSFSSPSGAGATIRYSGGGWYEFAGTDANLNQGATTQTLGTANVSYAAHASLVAAAAGTATGGSGAVTIVVSGTSIDDEKNRSTGDSETIVSDITAMSTNAYFETTKKWLGTITYTLTVGGTGHTAYAADFNYGFSKYEDFGNQQFTVTGLQVAGVAGANDTNFNMILFHHSPADWTYAASGFVPGGTQLGNMNTDHSTEQDLANGEPFAWKRVDINTGINGADSEGIVFRIDTSSAKAVESMSGVIWVHTAPAFSYMSDTKQHLIFMEHAGKWLEL